MQEFYIRKNSTNPYLEMELIKDGRYDFQKSLINEALQDCDVTFSMADEETNMLKISKAKANIVAADGDGCEEKYILQYKWTPKDTAKEGFFNGWFTLNFNGNLTSEGVDFPSGVMQVPIEEDLKIIIK